MGHPKTGAIVSGIAVVLIGASILFGSQGISPALATTQYVFLALAAVGLIGSLVQLNRKR